MEALKASLAKKPEAAAATAASAKAAPAADQGTARAQARQARPGPRRADAHGSRPQGLSVLSTPASGILEGP